MLPGRGRLLTSSDGCAFYIHVMARTVIDSPIGPLGLVASATGLREVRFHESSGALSRHGARRRSGGLQQRRFQTRFDHAGQTEYESLSRFSCVCALSPRTRRSAAVARQA